MQSELDLQVAEYRALVNHLVNVHGLDRDAVKLVAYDTRNARALHRLQGPCNHLSQGCQHGR